MIAVNGAQAQRALELGLEELVAVKVLELVDEKTDLKPMVLEQAMHFRISTSKTKPRSLLWIIKLVDQDEDQLDLDSNGDVELEEEAQVVEVELE